jgi:hypothetical protein
MTVERQNLFTSKLRVILYKLRRQFRCTVIVREQLKNDRNFQTGVMTQTWKNYTLYNQIVLKKNEAQQTIFKDGIYKGGFHDQGTRWFILDTRDLPFTLTNEHTLKFEDEEFSIKQIDRLDFSNSLIVHATNTSNENT